MSKTKIIIALLIFIFCFLTIHKIKKIQINNTTPSTLTKLNIQYNGWLKTNGAVLENEKGEPIQLKGISSHGIEWFYDVLTYENLKYLKDNWDINVFRIAMYTDSNGKGYIYSPEQTKEKVCNLIDIAIELDLYVIVDWHILDDNNPQTYTTESITFFDDISKKYANTPNIIYEICNEPNGNNVTWEKNIKPYAEQIIPVIRKNSKKSLIIVGTANWCTKLNNVIESPLNFENIIYACHFYSGSHGKELRNNIKKCIENNIPIFISECGLTDADGDGELYYDEFNEWINFINSNNLSWVYWSFSNKNESSAILIPNYTNIENCLSDAGKFIEQVFKRQRERFLKSVF